MQYISDNIRNIRRRKGLSQQELGNLIGTTSQHISNIELGKTTISIDLLMLISDALQVSPNDLIGYRGQKDIYAIMKDSDNEEKILIDRLINDIDSWYRKNIIK